MLKGSSPRSPHDLLAYYDAECKYRLALKSIQLTRKSRSTRGPGPISKVRRHVDSKRLSLEILSDRARLSSPRMPLDGSVQFAGSLADMAQPAAQDRNSASTSAREMYCGSTPCTKSMRVKLSIVTPKTWGRRQRKHRYEGAWTGVFDGFRVSWCALVLLQGVQGIWNPETRKGVSL